MGVRSGAELTELEAPQSLEHTEQVAGEAM